MVGDLGLNSDLKIGKHKIHVQTSYVSEERRIVVEVFEKGALLDKRANVLTEEEATNAADYVRELHEIVLADIELMLAAAQKIKSGKDIASTKKVGLLLLEKGFYEEAAEHFEAVVKNDQSDTASYSNLGKAYLNLGDYPKAVECISKAQEISPDYPDLYLLKAKALWKNGQYSASLGAIQKAVDLQPEYHQAYYTRALFLLESVVEAPKDGELLPPIERIKQAADNFKMAADLCEDYNKKLMAVGFELLDERDKLPEALELFKKAQPEVQSKVSVTSINSEFYLKYLFAGLENDSQALNNYINTIENTLSKHSEYADLHHGLGIAYLIKAWHFFAKSIEEFKAAVKINPSYSKAEKNLKLAENEGRGLLLLLRAILKQD